MTNKLEGSNDRITEAEEWVNSWRVEWWKSLRTQYRKKNEKKLRQPNRPLDTFQVALVVKNLPANAGDIRDVSSIPESEDPLSEGMATHSSILSWRIPWREKPGGLESIGSQRVGHS